MGLNLMGSIGAWSGPGSGSGADAPPASAGAAAFGPGYTSGPPSNAGALRPTRPVPIAFWVGAGAMGFLGFLRHSLPADRRRDFDMVLLMLVAWEPAKGVIRLPLTRLAHESQTENGGVIDTLARAGLWILGN